MISVTAVNTPGEKKYSGPGQGVSAAEPAGFSQLPKEQASIPQGAISATD